MIWTSGWRLASSVSNSGGLGLIGAGSMYPDIFREHIRKCKQATSQPFGVNVPLIYPDVDKLMQIIAEEEVKIVFTSAGNPKTWTAMLKQQGITVVQVVSSAKFAQKSEQAGVDAIVAEGFEAGGHNGREETTTLCLIPMVRAVTNLPLLAAGGIATGRAMLAAMTLGADGVQVGTRFAASEESSLHPNFKQKIIHSAEGETMLTLKQITPVRVFRNKFYYDVENAINAGAPVDDLVKLLGRARAKRGMFEGDLDEGELEIGQISGLIKDIKPAAEIVEDIMTEFRKAKEEITSFEL